MTTQESFKAVANWLNLSTPVGLLVARLGHATVRRGPRGLLLAEGYSLPFPVASAFTIGNVLITSTDFDAREAAIPGTIAHEEQHTRQYAYCFGLPFFPAYAATMAWSWLRTGNQASACFFEVEAGLERGNYAILPTRPLRAGFADLGSRVKGFVGR